VRPSRERIRWLEHRRPGRRHSRVDPGITIGKQARVNSPSEAESLCGRIVERAREHAGTARFDRAVACVRLEVTGGSLLVRLPNETYAKWFSGRFGETLLRAARDETRDSGLALEWRIDEDAPGAAGAAAAPPAAAPPAPDAASGRRTMRPAAARRFDLDGFVIGEGNRLAHAMVTRLSDPVAAPPAKILFLHGECGVGKTHLLRGLAGRYGAARGAERVRYLTGEDFTNEYIASLRIGKIEAFRTVLRRVELLCIDDVHFIAGKTGTQQEFLHTFDALDMSGARVALASDAEPREIAHFNDRLVSRCLSGMVVEIRPPDEATRREIIARSAAGRGLVLDRSAAGALAAGCAGSVRDVEGVLARLQALASVMPDALNPDGSIGAGLARRALGDGSAPRIRKPIRVAMIADIVCRSLGVDLEDIRRRKRHRRVVLARSLVAYLARQLTTQSYPEIAQALGCGSHSTMIDGCSRVRQMVERDESCDGEVLGSSVNARDLCDRLKRMVMNTSPPLAEL
jgi:chromosomal replication initiator protein